MKTISIHMLAMFIAGVQRKAHDRVEEKFKVREGFNKLIREWT